MVLRPGGKEGRPSGGAADSADISASLGVAESVQTSEEEQACVVVVAPGEREEEGMPLSAAGAASVAASTVVVAADARRRRLEVSSMESHHCVSIAVEGWRRDGKKGRKSDNAYLWMP
jgi:hypothetical protein